eukprot:1856439-Rhodomonas_salina.2
MGVFWLDMDGEDAHGLLLCAMSQPWVSSPQMVHLVRCAMPRADIGIWTRREAHCLTLQSSVLGQQRLHAPIVL